MHISLQCIFFSGVYQHGSYRVSWIIINFSGRANTSLPVIQLLAKTVKNDTKRAILVKKHDEDERNVNGGDRYVDKSYYKHTEDKYGYGKGRNKDDRLGKGKGRKVGQNRGNSYRNYNKGGPFKNNSKPQYPASPSYTGTGRRHKRSLSKLLWKLKQKFIAKKKKGRKSEKDNVKKSYPPAPKYHHPEKLHQHECDH